jgi:hypothetical protein
MPGPRVPRELSEMVERLEVQLSMLETFARSAFADRKEEFLPEVATKLRVLLVRSRHNKPLLLEVAQGFDIPLNVTLDGPPGVRWSPEQVIRRFPAKHPPGRVSTLRRQTQKKGWPLLLGHPLPCLENRRAL